MRLRPLLPGGGGRGAARRHPRGRLRVRLLPLTIRFDDQVVLVTGAGRGLGEAYAVLFADLGAHVVVHDAGVAIDGSRSDPSVADAVVGRIRERGGAATPAYERLGSRRACHELVERAHAELGRLDAVVHNAGILIAATLEELTPESWEQMRAVHVEAPLWVSQAALPHMRSRGYGRLVLTVSGHGLYRAGDVDLVAYNVCKGATFGLMNVLADAGAPFGVLVNAVSPVAATRMSRREVSTAALSPELVAPGVAFLASSACRDSALVLRAEGGRFSLGRYGVTEGIDLGPTPVTPDEIAASWSALDGPLRLPH